MYDEKCALSFVNITVCVVHCACEDTKKNCNKFLSNIIVKCIIMCLIVNVCYYV